MQEITVPGTNTKIPVVGALAAALVIAVIVILRRGGDETEQEGNVSGLLAAELDQRLREQWEATVNLIAEAMEEVGQSDPITPPAAPVDPTPKVPPKTPVDPDPKIPFRESEKYDVIIGGPVRVIQDNPLVSLSTGPVMNTALPKVSLSTSQTGVVSVAPPTVSQSTSQSAVVSAALPNNTLYNGQPDGSPFTGFGNWLAKPAAHTGGASLYTLGSYDLM